jgi:hypothetical protein
MWPVDWAGVAAVISYADDRNIAILTDESYHAHVLLFETYLRHSKKV